MCRALINQPRILLADEPTGNLDRESAALVINTMRRLAHEGGSTVVIATHDPFVLDHVDQVLDL